jgi:hypothetical protein
MRGARRPARVDDRSSTALGSGAVVPMPTLFCAKRLPVKNAKKRVRYMYFIKREYIPNISTIIFRNVISEIYFSIHI